MRVEGQGQGERHHGPAPSSPAPCRVAGHQGHGNPGGAGRRVSHPAVHHRGEVAAGDDGRTPCGVGAGHGALRRPHVEPDRQRNRERDQGQEQVEADQRPCKRDGQPGRHRQALTQIRRCVIPAEKRPLPANQRAVAQRVDAVERDLQQARPVVVERDLVPHRRRKRRQEGRGQQRPARRGDESTFGSGGRHTTRAAEQRDALSR